MPWLYRRCDAGRVLHQRAGAAPRAATGPRAGTLRGTRDRTATVDGRQVMAMGDGLWQWQQWQIFFCFASNCSHEVILKLPRMRRLVMKIK